MEVYGEESVLILDAKRELLNRLHLMLLEDESLGSMKPLKMAFYSRCNQTKTMHSTYD